MTQSKPNMKNNAVRRRVARQMVPKGKAVPYNAEMPRHMTRKLMNQFVQCRECGDRMLLKNMNAHVAKALLHQPVKEKGKIKKPKQAA